MDAQRAAHLPPPPPFTTIHTSHTYKTNQTHPTHLSLVPGVRQDVLEVVRVPVLDLLVLPRREEAVRPRDEAERHAVVLVREEGAVVVVFVHVYREGH